MTLTERRLKAFFRNRTAIVGLVLLGSMMILALGADFIAPFDPEVRVGEPGHAAAKRALMGHHPDGGLHVLGTDLNGFDVFSRLIHGARTSLLTAFASMLLALLIGVPLGAIAGWRGGLVGGAIMRITDVALAFPSILIAISIAAIRGENSLSTVVYAVGVVAVPPIIRQVRAAVLQVRELEYVTAARALGLSPARILFQTVLPNCLAPVLVLGTLGTGVAVLDAAGLSFLGLGPPATTPEWGVMLTDGFQYALDPNLWFLLIPPGVAIAVTVLGFNLVGDGLRDAFDPRTDA